MGRMNVLDGMADGHDGSKILIRGRKKGEKVPRKLVLRDGTRLDVLINERKMQNLIIDKMVTIYDNHPSAVLEAKPLYLIAEGHLPDNAEMRYYIVDQHDIRFIRSLGEHYQCLVRMSPATLKRMKDYKEWHKSSTMVYRVEPSVDLNDFFKRNDWQKFSHLWIHENLEKSWQLVDSFKTNLIPLIPSNWKNDSELSKLQYFNNHSFWITSTKSGKSELAKLVGLTPSTDFSIAGLFGGTVSNGKKSEHVVGSLEGYGMHIFDECLYLKSYDSTPVVNSILGYMQQGTSLRELKIATSCRGTKSLIFASNPTKSKDMTTSFVDFLKALSGSDYPDKIGSRVGSIVFGKMMEVRPIGNISEYRGVGYRILDQCIRKYYFSRIYPILKTNMEWACETADIRNAYLRFSRCTANESITNFIEGLACAAPKTKLGAVRLILFDNLDLIAGGSNLKKFQKNVVEKNREQVLQRLLSANMQSLALVSHADDSLKPEKKSACDLKQKFPKMSSRDIGIVLGCSKSSVANWLSEERLLSDSEESENEMEQSKKSKKK
jgi:hypothetical protein